MKIFLSILLLCIHINFAQESSIAIIAEPQVGDESNAENLINAVNDINKRVNIYRVVVLGNITANGKFDEFIWAQEILDGLNVPYSVVGGDKDYLLSEGNGSEISQIWGSDENIFDTKGYSLVCINTLVPDFPEEKYIDVETITSLKKNISGLQTSRILTFSYYPVEFSVNSYNFFEPFLNKKIFSFVSREEKSDKNKSTYEGLYLNRRDAWGYLLVSTQKDDLIIKKILSDEINKKIKPEIITSNFSKPMLLESERPASFIQKESIIWLNSFDKTINQSSVCRGDKIFVAYKNGIVQCLNSDGKEKWHFETNKRISNPPIIDNDILLVASEDGDIITLNINTGNPYQIIGIGEKITSGASIVEFDVGGDKTKAVLVGTQYGNIYCYDLYTLNPIWTQQLSDTDSDVKIVSKIVSSNNKIFFFDNDNSVYCLSAMNGLLIWKFQVSKSGLKSDSDILSKNNSLYLIDRSGNLFCVDALLGENKWNLKNINANGLIKVNSKNELILPTTKNKIAAISAKLGKITTEIELPGNSKNEVITDILILDDKMLVGCSDGWVYKINSKHKVEKLFRNGIAPIISLIEVNGNCLVTDYDGQQTLLNVSSGNK